ncbi:LLM class flavin-dependent oxidoreductase [Halobacillus halophilus]|uniref:Luciferase family oxidoreductase n=1 Tax=Halobacillus halophilus (strain ATCC 35676 / DSM 2266 / JCM 20832 / KCTC 3685 / LMG 17431 / NBRC 102448 / NCIMB 2269) TaxID=866895 RepID=I0JN11_HALH3|nr:LLM class flavin-dependent oxidoreductase [Halobacillus halophilus]CCG45531.1 luciferase family oxidoreductase [Halobacillus halophilus DSM 2266]
MKLSVLDQSPISKGETANEALHHSIELAKFTENLGYYRYWVAEHHSTNGLASSSPEILIGQIAQATNTIRVGSGGVLLPQYSPLKVAENFRMLENFHPGRIDLGLGRSPGGGKKTRLALTDGIEKPLSSFSRQVKELQKFLFQSMEKGDPYFGVTARPDSLYQPEIWVLGLTERGAKHAAMHGTGFTFGHFINPDHAADTLQTYREKFKPSLARRQPEVNACVFVVCANTEEEAEEMAKSQDMWLLQVEKGLETRIPPQDEVSQETLTEIEKDKIRKNRRRCIIGNPVQVVDQLESLADEYRINEFLMITNIFDFKKKKHSYQLIANEFANRANPN